LSPRNFRFSSFSFLLFYQLNPPSEMLLSGLLFISGVLVGAAPINGAPPLTTCHANQKSRDAFLRAQGWSKKKMKSLGMNSVDRFAAFVVPRTTGRVCIHIQFCKL
jgi:hypothetical protein